MPSEDGVILKLGTKVPWVLVAGFVVQVFLFGGWISMQDQRLITTEKAVTKLDGISERLAKAEVEMAGLRREIDSNRGWMERLRDDLIRQRQGSLEILPLPQRVSQ